ncbi:MAG: Smr/MutS family protein [Sedimentitalea sp.]
MARRKLTEEEIALWQKVVDQAEKLHPDRVTSPRPLPKPTPTKPPTVRAASPAPTPLPKPTPAPSLAMDRKAFTRMKRGKLSPEGKLDLHGMTLDRAHPALIRFVLSAQASGKRLVLVITGKGRTGRTHDPFGPARGVLKRQVPMWLGMAPLAHVVLQVNAAHISHGGDGAFYVYLRKPR